MVLMVCHRPSRVTAKPGIMCPTKVPMEEINGALIYLFRNPQTRPLIHEGIGYVAAENSDQ